MYGNQNFLALVIPTALVMIVPVIIMLVIAVKTGDLIISTIIGSVPAGAECTISFMSIILSAIMGLNVPAILTIGPSFARPLSEKHKISK